METTKHPIDFSLVSKGTRLATHELVSVLGKSPADGAAWSFALIDLCERIEDECDLVAKIENDGIRVLTDSEACEYLFRQLELGARKMTRATRRRALIDRDQLTDAQRKVAESRDRIALAVSTSARGTLRKLKRLEALEHVPIAEWIEPDGD
jgi:hypothetical protein